MSDAGLLSGTPDLPDGDLRLVDELAGELLSRLRTDRTAQVVIAGLAMLNLRRGYYELAAEAQRRLRVAAAFAGGCVRDLAHQPRRGTLHVSRMPGIGPRAAAAWSPFACDDSDFDEVTRDAI